MLKMAGQRNKLPRQSRNKRRLNQRPLDQLLVHFVRHHGVIPFRVQVEPLLFCRTPRILERTFVPVLAHALFHELPVGHLAPWRRKVNGRPGVPFAEVKRQRTENSPGRMGNQVDHQLLHPSNIGVGFVDFQHRELGVMTP